MLVSLPQFHRAPPKDNCGPCTVCCDAIGVPDLGKPFYARCPHLKENVGCQNYEHRPGRCREYRCVWHLGILGERVDRRPDHCGVLFQLQPDTSGNWYIGMFEVIPGSLKSDKALYLRDIILASKQIRHLRLGTPPVHMYPYGVDVPTGFPISPAYDYAPPEPPMPIEPCGSSAILFTGHQHELIMPST
jgi:hypothetical protein